MARSAVLVTPPRRVGRQEAVDGIQDVGVASGPGLEDRNSGGGMRDEHRNEPVALVTAEVGDLPGEIERPGPVAGLDPDLDAVHVTQSHTEGSYRVDVALPFTPDDVNELVRTEFPAAYAAGQRCIELGDGMAVARWTFDEAQLRPGAYISGPTLFSLADCAFWFATFTVRGLEPMAVTSELSIRFLRPAQHGDVLARATLNSVSSRRLVGTIEMWVDGRQDKLVAVAQGAYARP